VIPLVLVVALRNLARSPLRNTLTAVGVAIAVAILVMTVSVAVAFKAQIRHAVRNATIDLMVQSQWSRSPMSSVVSQAELEALARVPGVRTVTPVLIGQIRAPWSDSFTVVGVSSLAPLLSQMRITEGRPFVAGRNEIILGQGAAARLRYGVGNKMLLRPGQLLTITGTYSFGFGIMDGAAIIDLQTARGLTGRTDSVNFAVLQLADASDAPAVAARIAAALPSLTAFRTGELAAHVVELEAVDLFAWIVTVSTAVACVLGVAVTLSMTVVARTRDIGVLAAIGWSRGMIARTVLAEGVVLCLVAALLGNTLARIGLWVFDRAAPIGLGSLPVAPPPVVVIGSLVIAAALGALSALYPAAVASRVMPAQALRYE
jgi:putative ABC transport system permease protein